MKTLANILGVLVLGFIILAILVPTLNTSNQATYTRAAVWEYGQLRLQAEKGDVSQAAYSLKSVLEFWPAKVPHEGTSAGVVAAFRDSTVREIVARMRLLSGEDLGENPEPWLKKYYKDPKIEPNPQGGPNGRQPVSSDTNSTSAAAASRRSP